jgi:signal transduction histidine kinase
VYGIFRALADYHRGGGQAALAALRAAGGPSSPDPSRRAPALEAARRDYQRAARPRLGDIAKRYRKLRARTWPRLELKAQLRELENLLDSEAVGRDDAFADWLGSAVAGLDRELLRLEQQLCLVMGQDIVDVCRQVLQGRLREGGALNEVNVRFHKQSVQPVLFERDALYSVIEHLVTNAIQAMDGRRRIDLDFIAGPPDRLVLEISDSGAGVDAAIAERIFEEGYSTRGQGRGWGLKMVREQMGRFEGEVRLKTGRGPLGGACFELKFVPALGRIWSELRAEEGSGESQKSYSATP